MNYRVNPKNKDKLSALGFGCMRFTRDEKEVEKQIIYAIENGVNYFDTAYLYPNSEAILGRVLAKGYRDRVKIATKMPPYMVKKYFEVLARGLCGIIILKVGGALRKLKIYLETTILNFYYAHDDQEKMEDTRKLFDEISQGRYISYTSMSVVREISKAQEEKRIKLLDLIRKYNIEILEDEPEAERIADIYVKEGIIPAKYITDGLHIALATVHDMDIILSWNFKHIVKRKTMVMTNVINHREGYKNIDIYSPSEVIESDEE